MKYLWKKTVGYYLLFLGILIFSSTILSPDFHGTSLKEYSINGIALVIYRLPIFSIFSLLFATLFALQHFERQNVTVAISMSGKHSFALLRPLFGFALALSMLCLFCNAYLLGPAISRLGRDGPITKHKDLQVFPLEAGTVFFSGKGKNFTFVTKEKEIYYSARASKQDGGFLLDHMEHFIAREEGYEKVEAASHFFLSMDTSLILPVSKLALSASLPTLFSAYFQEQKSLIDQGALAMTLLYRTLFPFLHLFAVALAAIFGFARRFRKKYYLSLALCIFSSLFSFYLLECSAILATGNKASPLFFLLFSLVLLTIPSYITYAKKV